MRASLQRGGVTRVGLARDAAILADRRAEPALERLARRVEQRPAPAPDAHRRRRVDDRGKRQRDVFEHDARLQVARARRRRPVDAANVVAGNVGAQLDELVAVAAVDRRRARTEVSRPPARAQQRVANGHGAGMAAIIASMIRSALTPSVASR